MGLMMGMSKRDCRVNSNYQFPSQQNSDDCGVMVLMAIETILTNPDVSVQAQKFTNMNIFQVGSKRKQIQDIFIFCFP